MIIVNEAYLPPVPKSPPNVVSAFEVKFSPPRFGWIRLDVDFDAEHVCFAASDVFFTFESLKEWMEEVAAGGASCLEVNVEGYWAYLVVASTVDPDMVHFSIGFRLSCEPVDRPNRQPWRREYLDGDGKLHVVDSTYQVECHIIVSRRRLVESIYRAILEIWEKPDVETFWREWDYSASYWDPDWDDEPEAGTWYHGMRSSLIDAYLAV